MSKLKTILPKKIYHSQRMYDFCKNYIDEHNGENNHYITTNGELKVIKRFITKADIVFDVGAHVGDWTNLALKVNSEIEIHCFEPSKKTYQKLIKNNFSTKVYFNNIGLSSTKKTEKLYLFDEESPLNSLYQRTGLENLGIKTTDRYETIELDTLDNYCQEKNISHIDFLKIDIEGHELEAFRGGIDLLKNNKINVIQFEYGGCNIDSKVFLKDIFEFFKPLNYSLYKIYPDGIKKIERYYQKLDNFQLQNWLATSEST
jgi:FkbM family methyltransferase